MTERDPVAELTAQVLDWLDDPQSHLNDQTRRRVLELIVTDHVARVRVLERNRARAKDFLLVAAVLTIIGGLWPQISNIFGS